MLEWKRIYIKTYGDWGKRSFSHHEARHNGLVFKIIPYGGFITVKRYWLEIHANDKMIVEEKFYMCKDAKEWAKSFWKPQIKEFYPNQFYFAPSGAMQESGIAGPYLDYWGPYSSRDLCLEHALKCHIEAQVTLDKFNRL